MRYDANGVLHALLAVLGSSSEPTGTRTARTALDDMGFKISESSVSRRLRELDDKGWTTPVGTKGRVLSQEGRQRLEQFEQVNPMNGGAAQTSVDIRDFRDVIDLLQARKAVESAAAADAAAHATDADIAELRRVVDHHREALGTSAMAEQPGLGVHRKISSIAPNPMLRMLTGLVLGPHLNGVEATLDIALGFDDHQHGVVDEHQEIVDAIADRDAELAERRVNEHFDHMIVAAEDFLEKENVAVVDRLLAWMKTASAQGYAQ
jgi:GntR family transcriptional repressor for pyruvate dehydrogenase complex